MKMNSSLPEKKEVPVAGQNQFVLRNLQPSKCFLRVPNTKLSLSNTPQSLHSHLSYNHDNNPYTPAFIQFTSKDFYSQQSMTPPHKSHKNRQSSRHKTAPGNMCPDLMLVAEPNSRFCSVCHEKFDNYFKHINHPVHLKMLEKAQGTAYIDDLVREVQRRRQNEEVWLGQVSCELRMEHYSETSIQKECQEKPLICDVISPEKELH